MTAAVERAGTQGGEWSGQIGRRLSTDRMPCIRADHTLLTHRIRCEGIQCVVALNTVSRLVPSFEFRH